MDKVMAPPLEAIADIQSGSSPAVGGFGLCGIPSTLIDAVLASGIDELELVSNNCGVDDWGLGPLLNERRVRRVVASYVGDNKEFARQYLTGELEVELTPQGNLGERPHAAGAGIPAFDTATGVGTLIADGGLPWRYHPDGTVAIASPPKPTSRFPGSGHDSEYVLVTALTCDYALVRAWKGDRHGNLVFHSSPGISTRSARWPVASPWPRSKSSLKSGTSIPTICICPVCTSTGSWPCNQSRSWIRESRSSPPAPGRWHRDRHRRPRLDPVPDG